MHPLTRPSTLSMGTPTNNLALHLEPVVNAVAGWELDVRREDRTRLPHVGLLRDESVGSLDHGIQFYIYIYA